MLGRVVVPQRDQLSTPLFRELSDTAVQFLNGLAELLLACRVRRQLRLPHHLGTGQAKRLQLPLALGVAGLDALAVALLLLFALFHALGEAGLRVYEAFSGDTHVRLSVSPQS